ncbi:AraC family transcriptional regulator [Alteribacter populi]|uniref:AraC family transcriptional regulator n=1 Tax=Alteribacter populi TaxID=2011011 RepID=UPI000BBA7FC9|nr:AraC family transcriptional regulator [Alteribacter populi]
MSYEVYKVEGLKTEPYPLKLLYVTHSNYDKGWHSTQHSHHFTELFYIVSGKGSFVLREKEIPVKENDLVIINPNVEHTEKSNLQDPLEYLALGVEGLSFSLSKEKEAEIELFTYHGESEEIIFYLKKLLYEIQNHEREYEIVCQNILEVLIIKLKREKNLSIQSSKPKNINKTVAFCKYYINQNFRENITLDTLAKVGNINKYYLAHRFKKDLDITPIEYLNQVRIKEAKLLLETTDHSIAEIATFNGFKSQSFFSQAFKRSTGLTPTQYRRKHGDGSGPVIK